LLQQEYGKMKPLTVYLELIDRYEVRIASWMERHGYRLLGIALGIVMIWFGMLKPLGMSPADGLVARATAWIPIPGFPYILAAWEVAIGVCFLFKPLHRFAVLLLLPHMAGTMLPLITLPEETWSRFPIGLTLEGQYIIKNLVLIAGAIVLGGKLRHRMRGAVRRAPDAFHSLLRRGRWRVAQPGEVLAREGEDMNAVIFIRTGGGVVRMNGREIGRIGPDQFIGEMSFLTEGKAGATVEVTEPTHYVVWDRDELRSLLDQRQTLEHALLATVNLDLVSKIRSMNRPAAERHALPLRRTAIH
jgi:CRP-like cAMP-binding protein